MTGPFSMVTNERQQGSDAPMRVTMIGDFPRSDHQVGGGVESVMLYLAQRLSAHDAIRLHVVTIDRWGMGARRVDADGYTIDYVPTSRVRGPLRRRLNTRRLCAAVQASEPDIVHAHIAGHYSRAAILSGFPTVLTLHGIRFLEANLRTGWVDRLYRRHVVRREEQRDIDAVSTIVSINPFIEETFGESVSAKSTRIENPVAATFFEIADPDDSLTLLYAGRITPRKDLLTLLGGFAALHDRYPEARLRIAGAPDNPDPTGYANSVQKFVAERNLEDSVTFLGNLAEDVLLREYRQAPFFVLSAVLETAPMSIGEAMAAGRVVVTTDAGGCRHMVEHGVSGMVVPIGDSEAFGNALLKCAADREFRRSLGERARSAARERFSADAIAERTIRLYRKTLGISVA